MTTAAQYHLALSCGDPQGVGPQICFEAAQLILAQHPNVVLSYYGPARLFRGLTATALSSDLAKRCRVIDVPLDSEALRDPPCREAGRVALAALDAALEAVQSRRADALVTAPLSKHAVAQLKPGFRGHTGYLGERCQAKPRMMLGGDELKIFLVTDHLPLAQVPAAITRDSVESCVLQAREALRLGFGIEAPRLAVLALNPHAGEGGELGWEEAEIIAPILESLGGREAGIEGPFSADTFFRPGNYAAFDGVVAMYHDQGLIPLKALCFGSAVNMTFGLPIIRTSPDHGTAFDKVGGPDVDSSSMVLAMEWALRLCRSALGQAK